MNWYNPLNVRLQRFPFSYKETFISVKTGQNSCFLLHVEMDIDISNWDFVSLWEKCTGRQWTGTGGLGHYEGTMRCYLLSRHYSFKSTQKCKSNDFKIRLWYPALIWPLREVSCYYKTLQALQLLLIFINSNCWFFFKVKLMKSQLSESTTTKQDKGNHSSFLILSGKYLFWQHQPPKWRSSRDSIKPCY